MEGYFLLDEGFICVGLTVLLFLGLVVEVDGRLESVPVLEVEGEDVVAELGDLGVVAVDELHPDHVVEIFEEGVVELGGVFDQDRPQQLVGLGDMGLLVGGGTMQLYHCHQGCKQLLADCYSPDQVVEEVEAVF